MTGMGGRDSEPDDLERRFDAAMMEIYERAGHEVAYWATRYLQMLRARGGLETARRLLHARATSDGYARLRDAGRLDLTVEAYALRPEFQALFTTDELSSARDRLEYFGRLVEAAGKTGAPTDPWKLAAILRARPRPDTAAALPGSRAVVAVPTLLRHEWRSAVSIPREASCWAPNKIAVSFDGMTTWPELVLVRLLEHAGWQARWTKNWAGSREFCVGVGEPGILAGRGLEALDTIHAHAPLLRGAGTWDVIAWRGSDVLFLESKQAASSDRLRETQLRFLEAGLDLGFELASFVVVEYKTGDRDDAPARLRRSAPPGRGSEPARSTDPELDRLLEDASKASAEHRIEYRDRVAAFGPAAIPALEAWVEGGGSPGFACAVLEAIAQAADPSAPVRALRRLRARQPGWVSIIDPAVARVAAEHRTGSRASPEPRTGDPYKATGTPPPALGPCGIPNRDGSVCQNPGRHVVGSVLSCTTHYKAATARGEQL